jgi:hypothetical protein
VSILFRWAVGVVTHTVEEGVPTATRARLAGWGLDVACVCCTLVEPIHGTGPLQTAHRVDDLVALLAQEGRLDPGQNRLPGRGGTGLSSPGPNLLSLIHKGRRQAT